MTDPNVYLWTKLSFGMRFICFYFVLVLISGGCHQALRDRDPIDRHESRLIYTRHARCRMDCRHITEREIKEILENGEVNYAKSEPEGRPDPKYALDGYTHEGQHLRVVFAASSRGLVVVTCIDIGVEWQCDCS